VLLRAQGVNLKDFFLRFDASGDGTLSHDEFGAMMRSLPVEIKSHHIYDIIRKVGMKSIKEEEIMDGMGWNGYY